MRYLLTLAALFLVALVALPASAFFLDSSPRTENLVVPVYAVITLAVGAGLGVLLLPPDRSTRTRALVGAGLAVAGAVIALVVFFLLVSGFDGA